MKIAFTICSNNYLAQAKTLGDSIKQTNPDYCFYIGLADKFSNEIDYNGEINHTIIPSHEIGIPGFDDLWKKYNIIEFNTCLKPFYFKYFIDNFPDLEYLFYFDPDIFIYEKLGTVEREFGEDGRILLTPHITTPINLDNKTPGENLFLNAGLYNLGFLGIKYPQDTNEFLEWWKNRTYHLGFINVSNGLFVDQLWINLVPLFFKNVVITKHPGLNMAPWNLHERRLSRIDNAHIVNDAYPLLFYHFSAYKYNDSKTITADFSRYNFTTNSDLINIYQEYHELLIVNGVEKMKKINCHYMEAKEVYKRKNSFNGMLKYYLKKFLPIKVILILNVIRN